MTTADAPAQEPRSDAGRGPSDAFSALIRERDYLRLLIANVAVGVMACDAEGLLTICNGTARLFFHASPGDDLFGAPPPVRGVLGPGSRPLLPHEHPLLAALRGDRIGELELTVAQRRGRKRVLLATAHVLQDDVGDDLGAVAVFHDVTDQRDIESELAELALHDPLTGLANRLLLSDRLQVAFDRASRDGGSVGVLLLDLDDFKLVNDTLGHDAGDELLVETAERLRHAVRPGDTVARLGGDEFVVVCSLGSASELMQVHDRLGWALRQPYHLRGRVVRVGASIGVASTADFDADPGGLLQDADADMYREKRARRHS